VDKACDLLNVHCCLLWLQEEQQLVVQKASSPEIQGWRILTESSVTGKAILSKQPSISTDADRDLPENISSTQRCGPALIAPLFAPGELGRDQEPIGAFSVYYPAEGLHDLEQADWDKNVLNILARYATLAIQNAEHQEAVRQAQERHTVTEAFAAVGDIASNLLHQLNNKIGTIPVRIEGIQDKCADTLTADDYLHCNLSKIQSSAAEAIQVVRENLFLLRPIKFSAVDPKQAVETALSAAQIPDGVRVFHRNLGDLPKVHACPQRLPLVFVNLFENAAKAMESQGEIFINGFLNQDRVEIQVKDSGPGISPEIHEKIFELSYSTYAPDEGGNLGFGLWWVKTLMARFGGVIQVESDGHSGTTFILELPCAETIA
jgi:signal transduction histidine kinase